MKIKRVYVAGLLTPKNFYNQNPAIDYLFNMRAMIRQGIEVMKLGLSPFIPALDFMVFLMLREDETLTEEMIKQHSLHWEEVCDCILLTPGWKHSKGTLAEIEFAKKIGIPVFENIYQLKFALEEEDE